MSSLWNSIFILAISLAAGYCLVCENCENYYGNNCAGPLETCGPSVNSCISTLVLTVNGTNNAYQIKKSCADYPDMCYATYNMSVGPLLLYSDARCCQEDGCNREDMALPKANLTKNGVVCPSCLENGKNCSSITTTECTGAQTRCYSFSGGIFWENSFVDVAAKGCTVEEVCLYPAQPYPATHFKLGYNLTCDARTDIY